MALNLQLNRWQNMVMQEHVETISFARFVMEDAIAGQSSESWIIEILATRSTVDKHIRESQSHLLLKAGQG